MDIFKLLNEQMNDWNTLEKLGRSVVVGILTGSAAWTDRPACVAGCTGSAEKTAARGSVRDCRHVGWIDAAGRRRQE